MWGRGGRGGRHAAPTGGARRSSGTADRFDLDEPHRSDRSGPRPDRRARPGPVASGAATPGAAAPGAAAPGAAAPGWADAATGPVDGPPVSGSALFEPDPATCVEPGAGAGHVEPMAIIGGSAITLLAGRIRRRHTIADLESPTAELRATLPGPGIGPDAEARRRAEPPRHARAAGTATADAADPPAPAADAGPAPKRADRRSRPGRSRRVPVTALVIGTLAVAAVIVVVVFGTRPDPVTATPAPPTVLEQPARLPTVAPPVADPAAAYLVALRSAAIPASRSGRPETEAAAAICEQSRRGVPDAELARALPAMLAQVDRRQAPIVVELAKQHYCP